MPREIHTENRESFPRGDQELIRKYLDNSLSREEELLVAQRYGTDPEFREALDGFEGMTADAFDALLERSSDRIAARVAAATTERQQAPAEEAPRHAGRVYQMYSFRRLAIAASAVLLLLVAGGIAMNQFRSSAERLYAANFDAKPYPDQITRGDVADLSQAERLAISAYNAGNYEVSVKYFRDLYIQYPDIAKYGLFLAISQMGVSEYREASATLAALRDGEHAFNEDATWYLGLCYVRLGEPDAAAALFRELAGNDLSFYRDGAQGMLKKLE